MSRTQNESPMEELLRVLFGDEPEEQKQEQKEVPTETKGFKSLVSEEEYKAIIAMKDSMEKYIEVHNKVAVGMLHSDLSSSYAKVQYMMLCDVFDDLQQALCTMYHVHVLNKEFIDDLVKESGAPSVEAFEHHMMMKKMLGK